MTAPHICEDTTMAMAITNHLHRNPWAWQAIAWTCLGCGQENPGTGEHCSKENCQENTSSSRGWALQNILDRMSEELILMGDPHPNTAVQLMSIELILETLFSPHERTLCGLLEGAFLTPTEPSANTCICVKALGLDNPVEEMAMLDLDLEPGTKDVVMEEVEDLLEVDRLTVNQQQVAHSWADEMELFTSGQADNVPLDIADESEDETSTSTHPITVTTDPFISTDIRMRIITNTTSSGTGTSTTTITIPSTSTTPSIIPNTSTSTNPTIVSLTSSERRQINAIPRPRSINYRNISTTSISTTSMPLTTTTHTASSSSSSSTTTRSRSSSSQLQGFLSTPAGATRPSPPHFSVPRHASTHSAVTVPAAMFWWCWDGMCGYSNDLRSNFCRHCGKSREYRPDMIARMRRNMGE